MSTGTSQASSDFFSGEVDLLRRVFTQSIFRRVRWRLHRAEALTIPSYIPTTPIGGGKEGLNIIRKWWEDPKKLNRGGHERPYASIGHLMLYEKKIHTDEVYQSLLRYWHSAVGPSLTPERAIELRLGIAPGTEEYVFSNRERTPTYEDNRAPLARTSALIEEAFPQPIAQESPRRRYLSLRSRR